jgi:hypothetical protein
MKSTKGGRERERESTLYEYIYRYFLVTAIIITVIPLTNIITGT